jgi:Photosynthetic reaction centre cytochrome C subunit
MRSIQVTLVLIIFIILGIAAMEHPAHKTQTADRYKNLQVLPKNITPDSLDRLMDGYNEMLGVDCKFCHVRDKKADTLMFDKDDKSEKEITRNMMRMTMDINKKYFQFNENVNAQQVQAVTCYTCHKGEPMPEKEKKKGATKGAFEFKSN